VVMESMGFPFMPEEAGVGGKPGILTFWLVREPASVGP